MTLYHKYIYMPPDYANFPLTKYGKIFVSEHAFSAMEDDEIQYFDIVTFSGKNIIEIDVDYLGKIQMLRLELPYDEISNLFVILSFGDKKFPIFMKTCFLQEKTNLWEVNRTDKKFARPRNMSFEIENYKLKEYQKHV